MQQQSNAIGEATIWRETDPDRINDVINHPSVRDWVRGSAMGNLDVMTVIASDAAVALFGEFGGFVFLRIVPGIYDTHSAVLPEGRGEWGLRTAKAAIRWMFEKEGALEIMVACPKGEQAVHTLSKSVSANFKYVGEIRNGWRIHGRSVPSEIFSLTKTDWQKGRLH
jgi:hypothetical protein